MADVILTGLADEGPVSKRAEEQLTLTRALGLSHYSLRFVDVGSGVKNAMQLTDEEVARLVALHAEFEVSVSSLASPIGKVKLLDADDGTSNRYVPFERYLEGEVRRAIQLAQALGTRLIRGFSFYPPREDDPWEHVTRAAEQLRAIAEACADAGVYFGLEVEANLVGRSGELEAALWKAVDHPHLGLVFDAGNLVCQGYTPDEVFQQYVHLKPGLLWLHIKDYLDPALAAQSPEARTKGHVAEDALEHFVPADRGSSDHRRIFADLKSEIPALKARLAEKGIPGVYLDLEPHLKGGGQFGGFSGVDGYGVALRALCRVLDDSGVSYHLTQFEELRRPGRA
ncbi:MAG TPA: sugar phosphate isomerase/epimerase family protein [Armatimonadota bacterium]|nr:sugar phosphate isomerase/epimerase family protein [Armatimonadota bacterium]